jgi:hypothetical protein
MLSFAFNPPARPAKVQDNIRGVLGMRVTAVTGGRGDSLIFFQTLTQSI